MSSPPPHSCVLPEEPVPLGDVPLAPFAMTGIPEAELARHLVAAPPRSDSEALQELRGPFPQSPLTVRVAADRLDAAGVGDL